MGKRRGRGEGSIYRRESDGLWCSFLNLGYAEDGRRKRRVVYGKTKREVQQKLLQFQKQSYEGIAIDTTKMTVGDLLDRWLKLVAGLSIRKSTYSLYEIIIRVHIKPNLGGVPLRSIQPFHVQEFLYRLGQEGKGERACQLSFIILKKALSQAENWGHLTKNPCEFIKKPRSSQRVMKYWSPEEINHFLHVAKGDKFYALYVLAVTTGLRQGELFGLQWPDFDESNKSLAIQRTVYELAGRLVVGEPKTASSRRKIDLPILAVNALQVHRENQTEKERENDWIFCDAHGNALRRSNFRKRSFLKILEISKLPKIRFHDLRHSAATLLLSMGVHPKVVQERLGHSRINVTLDTYSHVLPSLQKEAVEKIDEALKDDDDKN